MGRRGKVLLGIVVALIMLAAVLAIAWRVRHSPTHDEVKLGAISKESRTLVALSSTQGWRNIPKDRWPPTIASLNPQWVRVENRGVEVLIEGFFDGGWGYDIVLDGGKPPMPMECYQSLGRGIYWHGPC